MLSVVMLGAIILSVIIQYGPMFTVIMLSNIKLVVVVFSGITSWVALQRLSFCFMLSCCSFLGSVSVYVMWSCWGLLCWVSFWVFSMLNFVILNVMVLKNLCKIRHISQSIAVSLIILKKCKMKLEANFINKIILYSPNLQITTKTNYTDQLSIIIDVCMQ